MSCFLLLFRTVLEVFGNLDESTSVMTEKSYSYLTAVKRKTKVQSENEGFCLTVKSHKFVLSL